MRGLCKNISRAFERLKKVIPDLTKTALLIRFLKKDNEICLILKQEKHSNHSINNQLRNIYFISSYVY